MSRFAIIVGSIGSVAEMVLAVEAARIATEVVVVTREQAEDMDLAQFDAVAAGIEELSQLKLGGMDALRPLAAPAMEIRCLAAEPMEFPVFMAERRQRDYPHKASDLKRLERAGRRGKRR